MKKYFEGHQFVESNIQSFNTFVERGMQEVVDENKEAEPTIIPDNIDRFVIKFGKIWVGKASRKQSCQQKTQFFDQGVTSELAAVQNNFFQQKPGGEKRPNDEKQMRIDP